MSQSKKKIEFGDFQTPGSLAAQVCRVLQDIGISPGSVLEPTCGVGAFVQAARSEFPAASIHGYEINEEYLDLLRARLSLDEEPVHLNHANFFDVDWSLEIERSCKGSLLILGNLPWVTSAALGAIGGGNLPRKSNFLGYKGFDAITGKANFDISEWMMLALIRSLHDRRYDLAMLLKTATARKVINYVENIGLGVDLAAMYSIDAKKHFGAAVDASLLVIRFSGEVSSASLEYEVFPSIDARQSAKVGHRKGMMISDLDNFDRLEALIGDSPQKWRSGVKHDASSVMELTRSDAGLINGYGEVVDIEPKYLYPLMKGSDIGSSRSWRDKYVLVTQTRTGEDTSHIREDAPLTWRYLKRHSEVLDNRGSSIYAKGHRFSIFGIGDYAFRPWRIAICGLYKKLNFRLLGPLDGRPIMFDDTVYYVSFENELDARQAITQITSSEGLAVLQSMIFWDEKRPIKSSLLNKFDWSRVGGEPVDADRSGESGCLLSTVKVTTSRCEQN
ncbi:class I SAM-dependent methyltransferase [Stenotrophomonas sp. ESTM1D_MKCIP4_1]|uniref:class I SAM-dependent methyltransferase n=1 Tax=Stenotrophomonas sp. ESTM1D_MKCIP4_1 TaxID=2072414 RepID=UPI001C1F7FCC|nr:class I SAM-dependent methyltransferase [Stenotrophomonas sp. ESTM1D_MKCIP4_1]